MWRLLGKRAGAPERAGRAQSLRQRGRGGAWPALLLLLGLGGAAVADEVEEHRLNVVGEARRYLVVTPQARADQPPGPRPVLIALHGAMQTPESFRAYAGFDAAAAANGFVVVYPQGEGKVWNDGRPAAMRLKLMLRPGDDEAFLIALARRLVAEGVADPARLYLAGISNGGFMVQKMACEQAGLFAAYVAIMSTAPANYREECRPARPVPILFIHGTADPVIAYDGFWTPVGATLSAPDSAALYARLDGCAGQEQRTLPDRDLFDGTRVVERRWPSCRDGAVVALMSVERGGHQSPARVDTQPDLATPFLGLRNRDIDAGEEIWRFVSAFSLPVEGRPAETAPGVRPPAKPAAAAASARPGNGAPGGAPLPRPAPDRASAASGGSQSGTAQDGAGPGSDSRGAVPR
ncbi:PHB depolymerase family esterase [Xanthobacter sp. KR7-225]|uniref:alpha/beta hydrolase family esterase n=1 Tax=Xanthobacter sp. KR7-225 TaxID=3156613 RepID=UPI0032B3829F